MGYVGLVHGDGQWDTRRGFRMVAGAETAGWTRAVGTENGANSAPTRRPPPDVLCCESTRRPSKLAGHLHMLSELAWSWHDAMMCGPPAPPWRRPEERKQRHVHGASIAAVVHLEAKPRLRLDAVRLAGRRVRSPCMAATRSPLP